MSTSTNLDDLEREMKAAVVHPFTKVSIEPSAVLALIALFRAAEARAEADADFLANARHMVDGTPEGRAVLYAAMLRGWSAEDMQSFGVMLVNRGKPDPAADTPKLQGGPYRVYARSVSGWGVIGAQGRIAGFYDDPQSAQRAADELNGATHAK